MPGSLRSHALEIFHSGLEAADPRAAVIRHLKVYAKAFDRVWVVGAGKATARMAEGIEEVFGDRIAGGLVNVKDGHTANLKRIDQNECGHPVPDDRGVAGARRIQEIANGAGKQDLILCAISGGASALLPLPARPVTLEEKQSVTRLLLACGANIHEMNCVRKHLSDIKGGRLAGTASPAPVLSVILSDVIGDDLSVIGSGPTAPDPSTFREAIEILDRYKLRGRAPGAVCNRLERGAAGEIAETPKQLSNTRNIIVGSNRQAMDAAARKAKKLGYRVLVLSSQIEGETREVARMHAAILKEHTGCILSGGETTVTLRGDGLGGRNQEFVLAAAIDIEGMENAVVLSAGTDGTDGPTDAAGAIADGGTIGRARAQGRNARESLMVNDSYPFFDSIRDLIKTGPTGTNVMDLRIMLRPAAPVRARRKA